MAAFRFLAVDDQGRKKKGVMEGASPRQVREALLAKGLIPLQVHKGEEKRQPLLNLGRKRGVRLSVGDLALFIRQLSTLVDSGRPIDEALAVVADQTAKPKVKELILRLRSRVREGRQLAGALNDFPDAFPEMLRASVAAGEQSGKLGLVMENVADHLEESQTMRRDLLIAMIYPGVVSLVAISVVIGLLTYVVPQVVQVFVDFNQRLPLLTRVMMSISDFLRNNGLVMLLGFLGIGLLLGRVFEAQGPRLRLHKFLLRLPLIGRLARGLNTARFVRTLGLLTEAGVPLLQGMGVASGVITNLPLQGAVKRAVSRVREGNSLNAALRETKLFPPITLNLIASGESAGNLGGMLDHAAKSQEREVSVLIATLMGLFEPLLILTMGGIVLLIVLAVLLPIFELNRVF